ncbi:hypothetical protein RND71_008708 [Anisodus tanguticus]|uniref:Uncharacterized protein n=1 Tax=Anisodus tanguticus TaxID=243964 RepID=A0AAE1SP78_9SOLA|nr:hypothetical protein RND71_008708 [Anisodus tanguticus]
MDVIRSHLGGVKVTLCGIAQYANLVGVTIGYTITTSISMVAVKKWISYLTNVARRNQREIELIKTELIKSMEKNMTGASHAANEELAGFGYVRNTLRGQLVGGSSELDDVSIFGMAGSGKMTLARSFINEDSIVSRFNF